MVVGAIGARTTPFKTVRIDEVALQRHGITVETFDMSDIFLRMKAVKPETPLYAEKSVAAGDSVWDGVPDRAFDNIVRLGVTLDQLIAGSPPGRAGDPLLDGDPVADGHLAVRGDGRA